MKYEHPEIKIIDMNEFDIVTLSGLEGDGGEFDPLNPAALENIGLDW